MKIIVLTTSNFKYKEIENYLTPFGFKVNQYKEFNKKSNKEIIQLLNYKNCIVLREQTYLKNEEDVEVITPEHLSSVVHISELFISVFNNGIEITDIIKSETKGFIDINKKSNSKEVYNWDEIFISENNFKSYQEMKNIDNKFSARNKVLSSFVEKYATFKDKVDLQFNKFNQENVVEFNDKIFDLIDSNKYLKLYKKNKYLKGLMNTVIENGIFTRSSLNKKQRNYWYPSLNAGLPLVSKKDEIHEITFMFHDLMHHMLPDSVLTGNNSSNHKDTYVIHRMLSEAFTLVLADMIFVNELSSIYKEYDWEKRRIYPLFKSLNVNHSNLSKEEIKSIVKANVDFALLGNKESFKKLGANEHILTNFTEKYEKFFIEDYRWTLENYNNMQKKNKKIKRWYEFNKDIIDNNKTLDSIEKTTENTNNYEDKVWFLFEELWNKVSIAMDNSIDSNKEFSKSNAFKNYMLGQTFIFFNYNDENHYILNLIKEQLKKDLLIKEDINKIRSLYKKYLQYLVNIDLLSYNDSLIYNEIYPLFDAFFVNYEKELDFKTIKEVLNKLIIKN